MANDELEWLYQTASRMSSIIEVGCWRGKSTHALLSGCLGPVYAVDHWKGSPDEIGDNHADALHMDVFAQFMKNVGHFPNLKPVQMDSIRASRVLEPADMVFIDAQHSEQALIADYAAWLPKARHLICGHDYAMQGVKAGLIRLGLESILDHPAGSIWAIPVEKLVAA